MGKSPIYQTKQRQAILDYLQRHREQHVTVKEIAAYFEGENRPVGVTTIYRRLEELEKLGSVRRYTGDKAGACFQLVDEEGGCKEHFHLKCESCGKLYHVECSYLEGISAHILEQHGFAVNPTKITLYGLCENCRQGK